ncbi:uncharacterized protein K02A2.6-like [Uranotaenia lowii]|uniref:uncharacterized protein K02A2.6-like n=1 Tax=Uranotaenia lowii TaxID=190385 RepID=UPI002479AB8D|nr:uncharacterized protein K02A2.6-like [Uranotaenia lowii]
MHFNKDCRFHDHKCQSCGKVGHREGYCACFSKSTHHNKSNSGAKNTRKEKKRKTSTKTLAVHKVGAGRKFVDVNINNVPLRLQLDTGSDISILSHRSWVKLGKPKLCSARCRAKTASGEPLDLTAELQCQITINGCTKSGIDWLELFNLWDRPISALCNKVDALSTPSVSALQARFPEVFTSVMGLCNKSPVRLVLKGNPKPIFRPKRPVAYSMEALVEAKLLRLQELEIIKPVNFSDWAAPIVVVRKPNGSVRICADFSTGLNDVPEPNQYPLPLPEDILARMSGCRFYSHIDLSDAYLQVLVDEDSQPLLTINTHKGLFQFTRLLPGIKAAPGAFQQLIDTMLADLRYAIGYLDDILVGGRTEQELQTNVDLVLQRMKSFGFTVRIEKCSFFMREVKYLGQILDGNGIRPDPDKIAPIVNMPPPRRPNTAFVPGRGKLLRQIRQRNAPASTSDGPVAEKWHQLEPIVSADASNVGIGGRIAHRFPDGTIRAICHVSRSLTAAESNYSQIEKEGLALVFAVTRFHRMVFGRRFILETDHKLLLSIFGSRKGIPVYTANRLQRWALTLLLYDFEIRYISTDSFGHADILSRLINRHVQPEEDFVVASLELEHTVRSVMNQTLSALPLSFKAVKAETHNDDILQQIARFVDSGWPSKQSTIVNSDIQKFYQRRDGLSMVAGCLMYGERLVIPAKFQKQVLHQLHKGHPGIERMRSIARQYVYWPLIDEDISKLVRACSECASVAKTERKVNLESWPTPEKPWQRVHVNYAGPLDGNYYLIIVDSFSKWPEVIRTQAITSSGTMRMLRGVFARFGAPETLVSENGTCQWRDRHLGGTVILEEPSSWRNRCFHFEISQTNEPNCAGTQFTSEQFQRFCETNSITHLRTAPFHPQSNGLAERFVDTFKRSLKKISAGGEALDEAIDTFLLCYRSTPCRSAPGGKSPAEVLLGRPIRTSLDLLRPPSAVFPNESGQDEQFNRKHGAKPRNYVPQDLVWAKVFRNNKYSWEPGRVLERIRKVMYNIWLPGLAILIRSHCNQLRIRHEAGGHQSTSSEFQLPQVPLNILLDSWGLGNSNPSSEQVAPSAWSLPQELLTDLQPQPPPRRHRSTLRRDQPTVSLRTSSRARRQPVWYEPYHLY